MIRIGTLIALCSLTVHAAAQSDNLSARQHEILRISIASDGWLTEPMHREFWSAIPLAIKSDPKIVSSLVSELDRTSAIALRFQRATWTSIKLTLGAKRLIKVPEYEKSRSEILGSTQAPHRAAVESAVKNADAMLEAAATGKSVNGPDGPFYVSEELADSAIAGLNGSLHRFRKLTNPKWQIETLEYSFSEEHIRIISDGPFTRETQTARLADGKVVPITLLSLRFSENDHVAVSFTQLQGRWADPEGAAIRTVKSALAGLGIAEARPIATRWRGRISAEANGLAKSANGTVSASVRVVEAREYDGAWQFLAISTSSLVDAISLREKLERNSNLGIGKLLQ